MAGQIVPGKTEGALTPPPHVARAIQLMRDAGFDGNVEYRKDVVQYPGADYINETVTFERWDGGARETFMADLFARYPMITITEAAGIGLLVGRRPKGAKE